MTSDICIRLDFNDFENCLGVLLIPESGTTFTDLDNRIRLLLIIGQLIPVIAN